MFYTISESGVQLTGRRVQHVEQKSQLARQAKLFRARMHQQTFPQRIYEIQHLQHTIAIRIRQRCL